MKKPIEKLDIQKKQGTSKDYIITLVGEKIDEIVSYLFPEEGGEKCSKENGMIMCYCGMHKPADYPLPADFPRPSGKLEERLENNPLFRNPGFYSFKSTVIEFIRSEKEESCKEGYHRGYDYGRRQGREEALDDGIREGREQMKAELREKVKTLERETTMNGNLPLVHVNKGFNQTTEIFLNLLK